MTKDWKLHYGIHRGTITSRDVTMIQCDSLEDCKRKIAKIEKDMVRFGYVIWFANAISVSGEQVSVHAGNSNYK